MAVLISEPLFLDLRHDLKVPVVHIRRQGSEVTVTADADEQAAQSLVMDCDSGRFEPIIVAAHWKFPEDTNICSALLKELFGRWDVVEPFERLQKGLEHVHKEKLLST